MTDPEKIDLITEEREQTAAAASGDSAYETDMADFAGDLDTGENDPIENGGETTTESETQLPSASTLAQLLEEEEAVHRRMDLQEERLARAEQELRDIAETLQSQIAELEKYSLQAVQALETQTDQRLSTLESTEIVRHNATQRFVETAEYVSQARKQDVYRQAWESAPVILRLKFVRELLPENHGLQNVLKEAAALEELRRRGHDLEAWLSNYPALFADAMQALFDNGIKLAIEKADRGETQPAEILAAQALQDTRDALVSTLQALGLKWIMPEPGEPISADHEVIGEESSTAGAGRVARLRRRGFRFQGRTALPAQVLRAAASSGATITAPSERPQAAAVSGPLSTAEERTEEEQADRTSPTAAASTVPIETERGLQTETYVFQPDSRTSDNRPEAGVQDGASRSAVGQTAERVEGEMPDWLRLLSQRTFGCEVPAVSRLMEQLLALKDLPVRIASVPEEAAAALLTDTLLPLLPLLGLRYADSLPGIPENWGAVFLEARPPLLEWLEKRMELRLVAPARGDGFDARTMDAVETRRTVHEKENETVAKLERIGVVWRTRALIPAQVVRYTTGGVA